MKKTKEPKSFSRTEVLARIRGLSGDQRKSVICALVGHSRLTTTCFGYAYCGRCGDQVGDSLMGLRVTGRVLECHGSIKADDCDCKEVAKTLTWRDTMGIRTTPQEWLKSGERK